MSEHPLTLSERLRVAAALDGKIIVRVHPDEVRALLREINAARSILSAVDDFARTRAIEAFLRDEASARRFKFLEMIGLGSMLAVAVQILLGTTAAHCVNYAMERIAA